MQIYLEVTLGEKGPIGVTSDRKINKTPIPPNAEVDTIGGFE
jgi:hypothetical protein